MRSNNSNSEALISIWILKDAVLIGGRHYLKPDTLEEMLLTEEATDMVAKFLQSKMYISYW